MSLQQVLGLSAQNEGFTFGPSPKMKWIFDFDSNSSLLGMSQTIGIEKCEDGADVENFANILHPSNSVVTNMQFFCFDYS